MTRIMVINSTIPLRYQDVHDEILLTVYEMLQLSNRRRKLRSEHCEGVVTTEFQHRTFVGSSGIEFNATIEIPEGTSKVHFIVSETAMRNLETSPEYNVRCRKTDAIIDKDRPNPVYEHYRRDRRN